MKPIAIVFVTGMLIQLSANAAPPRRSAGDPNAVLIRSLTLGEPPARPFAFDDFKQALEQGASPDARDATGQSALLLATIAHAYLPDAHADKPRLFEAMKLLLARGANVNAADKLGITPLMMAVHRAHTGVLPGTGQVPAIKPVYDLLLSATTPAPDLNLRNYQGSTALSYLASWGELDEMKRFLSLGADLYNRDDLGYTVFSKAGGKALLESLLVLVPQDRRKAVLELPAKSGNTLLMRAARRGLTDVVELLLGTYQVDPSPQNLVGESALSIAETSPSLPRASNSLKTAWAQIAQRLRQAGAVLPPAPSLELACDRPNAEPMSFERIRALIEKCRLTRLDELIPLLPASHRSNYLLSYKPRGIQKGSFSHPRVITFGVQDRTILSFNGDPALGGYDSLEMVELKPGGPGQAAGFEYRDVTFGASQVTYSKANPPQCLGCHGQSDPRPLWDAWYLWPGFYNSEQGAMYPIERSFYGQYLANRHQGRYQYLLEDSDVPLQTAEGAYDSNNWAKNLRFDALVQDLANDWISSKLVNDARVQPLKYAVMAAVSCSGPIEDFLAPEINASFPRKLPELLRQTRELDLEEFTLRQNRHASILKGAPEGAYSIAFLNGVQKTGQSYATETVSRLRYLLENSGVSMDWSTTFELDRRRYVMPGLWNLELKLWKRWLSDTDPDEAALKRLYADRYEKLPMNVANILGMFRGPDFLPDVPGADNKPLCAKLKELSLKRLRHSGDARTPGSRPRSAAAPRP